jgi:hypothetical protein
MKREKPKCETCGKKTRKKTMSCSECTAAEAADKKKGSKMAKLYFWLFVTLGVLAACLIWSARGERFWHEGKVSPTLLSAVIAIGLSVMFGLFCFIRFIRNRSIAGGLFITVIVSTAVFFGASQVIETAIPPAAAAFTGNTTATGGGLAAITGLAQVGLFTLWFLFLLLAIYMQISPVKKIDKTLTKIIDGNGVNRVKIGKSRQYRSIAEKLEAISTATRTRNQRELEQREKQLRQRERAAERKAKLLEIQKHQEERLA